MNLVVDGGANPEMLGYLDAPPGALDALFTGLAASESGAANGRTLLLFFGDSHTAGDAMTSRLRTTLQAQFGDAGRGLVAAGKPTTRHYYQRDVRYGASGIWRSAVAGKARDAEPFGVGGLRIFGERKGAELWVQTCAECGANQAVGQFEILYQAAPDRGQLKYRVDDGAWQMLSTKTATVEPPHPARQVIAVADGPHRLTIEHAGGGQVDLFGVVMERLRPGVIVDSLGVVGRRLGSLRSWDWSIIGEQLSTRDPRLVVLQYGTNEADDATTSLPDLARYYDDTILRIRAAAPTASILILGPPDMGAREAGKACDRNKPGRGQGRSTAAADRRKGKLKPQEQLAPDPDLPPECQWRTPGVLLEIIAVQHAAAARNKVAFFDTMSAMGGPDRMHAWALAEPRIAFRDHVHFTELGYTKWADALEGALLADYARWRERHKLPPSRQPVERTPLLGPSATGSGALPGSSPSTAP